MAEKSAKLPTWARAFAIVVGIIAIGAAFIVLIFPGIAILTLVLLLGIALMFIGIERLVAGISGHPYWWIQGFSTGTSGSTDSTPGAPRSPS